MLINAMLGKYLDLVSLVSSVCPNHQLCSSNPLEPNNIYWCSCGAHVVIRLPLMNELVGCQYFLHGGRWDTESNCTLHVRCKWVTHWCIPTRLSAIAMIVSWSVDFWKISGNPNKKSQNGDWLWSLSIVSTDISTAAMTFTGSRSTICAINCQHTQTHIHEITQNIKLKTQNKIKCWIKYYFIIYWIVSVEAILLKKKTIHNCK